jgi:hypothetical protein
MCPEYDGVQSRTAGMAASNGSCFAADISVSVRVTTVPMNDPGRAGTFYCECVRSFRRGPGRPNSTRGSAQFGNRLCNSRGDRTAESAAVIGRESR